MKSRSQTDLDKRVAIFGSYCNERVILLMEPQCLHFTNLRHFEAMYPEKLMSRVCPSAFQHAKFYFPD